MPLTQNWELKNLFDNHLKLIEATNLEFYLGLPGMCEICFQMFLSEKHFVVYKRGCTHSLEMIGLQELFSLLLL